MLRVYNYVRPRGVTLVGPNCPGVLSPGKANVGIIPAEIFSEGPVGLVSRSGTLTYQIGHELTQLGIGQSTIVGIGGDPVVGSSFIDVLGRFEADPETEIVVMVGEIGGSEEEKAADFIGSEMTKPVVAYIAGFTAPPGKTMGHAGAIISGRAGTAQAKKDALEAHGVRVGTSPTEVARLAAEVAGARTSPAATPRADPAETLACAAGEADDREREGEKEEGLRERPCRLRLPGRGPGQRSVLLADADGALLRGRRLQRVALPELAEVGGLRLRARGDDRDRSGQGRHGEQDTEGSEQHQAWTVSGVPMGMSLASRRIAALRRRMQPWETAPGRRSGRFVPWMPMNPPAGQSVRVADRALVPNAIGP